MFLKKLLMHISISLALTLGLLTGVNLVFAQAWTEPGAAPPGGNVPGVIWNSQASGVQQNASFYVSGTGRLGGGGAFGGFTPDAVWMVSSPNAYFGNGVAGTLIGAGAGQAAGDISTDGVLKANRVRARAGTAASPGISFSAEPDDGMYLTDESGGYHNLGLVVGGAPILLMDTGYVTVNGFGVLGSGWSLPLTLRGYTTTNNNTSVGVKLQNAGGEFSAAGAKSISFANGATEEAYLGAGAANPRLVLLGRAAQAGNLLEAKNSGGATVASISPAGDVNSSGDVTGGRFCLGGTCLAAWPAAGGGGDITAVNVGTGVTGGGATGDVTVSLDTAYTDGRYVNVTGDSMTGDLWLQSDAQQQLRFASAGGAFLAAILKSGATMFMYAGGDGTTPAAAFTGSGLVAGGDNQKDLGSPANSWRDVYVDRNLSVGAGGAFGGYTPDPNWRVTAPNGYFGDGGANRVLIGQGGGVGQLGGIYASGRIVTDNDLYVGGGNIDIYPAIAGQNSVLGFNGNGTLSWVPPGDNFEFNKSVSFRGGLATTIGQNATFSGPVQVSGGYNLNVQGGQITGGSVCTRSGNTCTSAPYSNADTISTSNLCIGADCRNAWPVAGGGGDMTGVTAGNGLTGGGLSGDVTLNVVGGTGITVAADLVSLDTAYADGRFVNVTGDTMTGDLTMSGAGTDILLNGGIINMSSGINPQTILDYGILKLNANNLAEGPVSVSFSGDTTETISWNSQLASGFLGFRISDPTQISGDLTLNDTTPVISSSGATSPLVLDSSTGAVETASGDTLTVSGAFASNGQTTNAAIGVRSQGSTAGGYFTDADSGSDAYIGYSLYGVYGSGVYGLRGIGNGAGTTYGVYGSASGGTTNWAGYFSGTGIAPYSNVYVGDNLLVGNTIEAIDDSAFATAGDELYVNGDAGVNGSLYVDGYIKQGNVGSGVACDVTLRGAIRFIEGAAGVKDAMAVCAKDAANSYGWRTIY